MKHENMKHERTKHEMKSEVIPLFSTPVVVTNIGRDFKEDELRFIANLPMYRDKENEGMQNHRSDGFSLFDDFPEELKDIKKFIENRLNDYLEHIEGVNTNLAKLRITQSWLNETRPGECHYPHLHPNSYLSGVLYINCLPNDGINFENRSFRNYNNMEFSKEKITGFNTKHNSLANELNLKWFIFFNY